ncbi:unnamed protein product, partial [marine sediment metagenome]
GNKANSSAITITLYGTLIFLASPAENYISSLNDIDFTFTFSSESDILNCSLYLDDILKQNDESSLQGLYITFEVEDIADKKDIVWKVECIDPDDSSINASSSRLLTVDTTPPTWSDNSTSRPSGSEYDEERMQFNITFTDNIEMYSVVIENNFTGTWRSDTMTCTGTAQKDCFYSVTVPIGDYSYRFTGEDTAGWTNTTHYFDYSVIRGTGNFILFLDDQDSDIWVNRGHNVDIYVDFIEPEAGTSYIYEDGVYMASCSSAEGCHRYKVY